MGNNNDPTVACTGEQAAAAGTAHPVPKGMELHEGLLVNDRLTGCHCNCHGDGEAQQLHCGMHRGVGS